MAIMTNLQNLCFSVFINDSFFRYRDIAKYRSSLMHDRPVKPMDLAVYWVEYVIRHKGAQHLRVAGVEFPWYKYHSLDVLGFLAAILAIICYVILVILRKLVRLFSRKPQKQKVN